MPPSKCPQDLLRVFHASCRGKHSMHPGRHRRLTWFAKGYAATKSLIRKPNLETAFAHVAVVTQSENCDNQSSSPCRVNVCAATNGGGRHQGLLPLPRRLTTILPVAIHALSNRVYAPVPRNLSIPGCYGATRPPFGVCMVTFFSRWASDAVAKVAV